MLIKTTLKNVSQNIICPSEIGTKNWLFTFRHSQIILNERKHDIVNITKICWVKKKHRYNLNIFFLSVKSNR